MGGLVSRLSKVNNEADVNISVAGCITEDPRSPTVGIDRTPIALDKRKPYLETNLDNVTPLRVQVLRRRADPRSPSEGIDRTPITFMQSGTNFDSPISVYSNNQTEFGSYSCLPSPAEASANVSGFETLAELDSIVGTLDTSLTESVTPIQEEVQKLTIKSDDTKKMCDELVKEIIDSFKEYENEVKNAKPKLKLLSAPINTVEVKPRKRKPLSNITSSAGNTPTKFNVQRKEEKLVKVTESGENSPMLPSMKVRAQWDHDSTVII